MASYVGHINIDNVDYPIGSTLYGTCSGVVSGDSTSYAVSMANFDKLETGITIHVKFTTANISGATKLKVGNQTAKTITNPSGEVSWSANSVISFTYDGTNWIMNDGVDTTYSTLDQTTVNTGTETTGKLVTAKIIKDTVTNAINALDVSNITTKLGAGKTITALSETNGKIAATASDIAITEGQVSQLSSGGWIAPLSSPGLTGTPTAPTANAGTNTTQIATTAFVVGEINSKLASNDAMLFKGTLGTDGTITSVPTNGYQAGWTYRVITAGTYANQKCEIGDLLIAINDGPATGSSVINADWTVAQTNIDSAVYKGTNTFTNGDIVIADGNTGLVKDSGYTIATSVPSGAVFCDTTYTSTASTTINYLQDANYIKAASVSNGVLTITAITNASTITPVTAITPTVNGAT